MSHYVNFNTFFIVAFYFLKGMLIIHHFILFSVDIWSVGCIMGEMLKGSVLFQGTDRILPQPFPNPVINVEAKRSLLSPHFEDHKYVLRWNRGYFSFYYFQCLPFVNVFLWRSVYIFFFKLFTCLTLILSHIHETFSFPTWCNS